MSEMREADELVSISCTGENVEAETRTPLICTSQRRTMRRERADMKSTSYLR